MTTNKLPASPLDHAERELEDLRERRERAQDRLRTLQAREAELGQTIAPTDPVPGGLGGRVVISRVGDQHPDLERRTVRAGVNDALNGIERLDRRIAAAQGYVVRLLYLPERATGGRARRHPDQLHLHATGGQRAASE